MDELCGNDGPCQSNLCFLFQLKWGHGVPCVCGRGWWASWSVGHFLWHCEQHRPKWPQNIWRLNPVIQEKKNSYINQRAYREQV
jgi:hypothetical protein